MPRLPRMRGPWATAWAVVASPWTPWALGLWVAAGAAVGLVSEPGQHPASGLALQLPAALLVFALVARDLGASTARLRWAALYAAGLATALVGGWLAGGEAGMAEVGGARPTESYTRTISGRSAAAHLGAQLGATLGADGAALTLAMKEHHVGEAVLPLDGVREAKIGRWALHLVDVAPGDEPAYARLKLTPRGGGDPIERAVRTGSGAALEDGTQVAVLRLSPDFGRALGPAAQIQVDWEGGSATAWHFVDSPDLDARVGAAPWAIELVEVATEPRLVLGVRRDGPIGVALAGFGVMIAALLGLVFAGRREGRS